MTWFLYALAVAAISLPLGVWLNHDLREAAARRRRRAMVVRLTVNIDQFAGAMRRASVELKRVQRAFEKVGEAADGGKR